MDLEQERASDGGREKRVIAAVVLLFSAVAILAMVDLVADFGVGTTLGHVLFEGAVVLAGIGGLALGLRRMRALRRAERQARSSAAELSRRLAVTRAEADRWRTEAKDLLQGLGAAIERQLVRWELTTAETEIGLLLLKGLSHRDIAELRGSSEATVRQQARAVYRKAGVEGRHDLAAFFLEGLIAPTTPD
jgi:DNA-binding CsgD family transcriptional regulator